jgi:soluble lytic murein transglycosylase-like protein
MPDPITSESVSIMARNTSSGFARVVDGRYDPGVLRWIGLALVLLPSLARADIWSYEDKDGVVHFTNVPPRSGGHRWRVIYKVGPGKARTSTGAAPPTSFAGCAVSRRDVVPATDRSPERFSRYDVHILEAARLYALPPPLIRAIIKAESDYDPRVISCAGAKGLMQLMPDVEREQHVTDVFEPRQNILGGSRLLRVNANRFKGDLVLTIAAYHAGPGAVEKYKGVPPYETTQQYVKTVLKYYYQFKARSG